MGKYILNINDFEKDNNKEMLKIFGVICSLVYYIEEVEMNEIQEERELSKRDLRLITKLKQGFVASFHSHFYFKYEKDKTDTKEYLLEFVNFIKEHFESDTIKRDMEDVATKKLESLNRDSLLDIVDSYNFDLGKKIDLLHFIIYFREKITNGINFFFNELFVSEIISTIEGKFWSLVEDTKDVYKMYDIYRDNLYDYFEGLVDKDNLFIKLTDLEKLGYEGEFTKREKEFLAYCFLFEMVSEEESDRRETKYVCDMMGISKKEFNKFATDTYTRVRTL